MKKGFWQLFISAFNLECAQDLWTSFKRNMLRLFRKELEEDYPTGDESQSGTTIVEHNKLLIWHSAWYSSFHLSEEK